ncbi:electron transfer flavoprotein subunit beta/FixA family protein [Cryobacterium sp. BB307]|uniref:electron transfer flavoprotein subunit beta/FixA family protein n=1 Tax=Cryobacterium sp. BB307 TaxID=2716317 RepID=UPI00144644B9
MRIIALIKQVPDTGGERRLDLTTGLLDRDASDKIIDEINERALEVALAYKDANKGTEVVVMTMGPEDATGTIRKALSMGADSGIHIADASLVGSDSAWSAEVLAAALQREQFDLVVAGNESTDGRGGVVPIMIAERLGLPAIGSLDSVELSDGSVRGERATESGSMTVSSALPAVISVTERAAEPRFPNFKGIMTAKKKPIGVLSLSELGLSEASGGRSVVLSTQERPARTAGKKIVDDGSAAAQLADFLAAERLI